MPSRPYLVCPAAHRRWPNCCACAPPPHPARTHTYASRQYRHTTHARARTHTRTRTHTHTHTHSGTHSSLSLGPSTAVCIEPLAAALSKAADREPKAIRPNPILDCPSRLLHSKLPPHRALQSKRLAATIARLSTHGLAESWRVGAAGISCSRSECTSISCARSRRSCACARLGSARRCRSLASRRSPSLVRYESVTARCGLLFLCDCSIIRDKIIASDRPMALLRTLPPLGALRGIEIVPVAAARSQVTARPNALTVRPAERIEIGPLHTRPNHGRCCP
jgi:hypothetical protein